MNEFWLWFWRPIAETLGVVALLAICAGLFGLWIWIADYLQKCESRRRQNAAARKAEVEAKARATL